jgi:ribosomal protein S18 acetylase RimI-like enzyme
MIHFAPVDSSQIYRAFMEAFADYAMDSAGTQEKSLLLRMAKNNVDYEASVGTYDGDRLVGFTLIGIDKLDGILTAYDAGTGIIPDFRGHGLASRMFDHALPELESRGVRRFLLEVLQSNKPAIKAYQKSGFEIVRELKCFVVDTGILRSLPESSGIEIRPTDASPFESLTSEADWTPSFENRLTVHRAIPHHVTFLGAHADGDCVGAIAYCGKLNWLLSLLVKRAYRRRGVGRALLKHLATTLPDSVTKLAALNVDGQDAGMQAFFESVGFSHLVDQYEMSRAL